LGPFLRLGLLLAVVFVATWAAHLLKEALNLTIMPTNEAQVHQTLMVGMVAYVGLLAIPFVPGAEVGIAMLTVFGAAIAPLVYVATVTAMMLSYTLGRVLPETTLVRLLRLLRLRRAADLVERAARKGPEERLSLLLEGAPPRTLGLGLRHRYVALAVIVNVPGNAVIGGGGGIMIMAGLSRIFAPVPTFLAIAVAVSPVPLMVMWIGA
jgi:hypothetical protein